MFGSSLPPIVYRRDYVLFTLLCLFVHSGRTHIVLFYCFVCLRLLFCVPNDAMYSGLSIRDCPVGFM